MKTTKNRWNKQRVVIRSRKIVLIIMVAFLATSLLGRRVWWAERVAARDLAAGMRHAVLADKVKANDLIKDMTRTAAYLGKAVGKQAKPPKADQPFFAALKKTQHNLKALSTAMTGKDDKKLSKAMDRTGKSINELATAYRLGGTKNAKADEGVKKLTGAFKAFRSNFGKEGLRKKKGGALSAQENQQIKALQDKYRKLAAELEKLKAKLGSSGFGKSPSGSAVFTQYVDSIGRILTPASGGSFTIDYYIDLLLFEEEFTGSWYAISSYVMLTDPTFYSSFAVVNTDIVDIDSYYYSTVETSFSYSSSEYFSYLEETSVDVSESYDVEITDAEVSEGESYIEEASLDVSADEYDITVGDEDASIVDHDDDGIVDSKDNDDDNDGTPDDKDTDDDGDGIPDTEEADSHSSADSAAGRDTDHDGTPDAKDADDDNDGTPDTKDNDDDGDGTPDASDADHDTDGDGTPDAQDADDDNDGTPDAQDADDDGDGTPDASDTDDANPDTGGGASGAKDTDHDGTPDASDNDDDNDGTPDAKDNDDDGDGTPDASDADHDTDGDGTPDAQDADDDNDGTPDAQDTDDDGDGTPDAQDADHDTDGDGTPDAQDADDDNDGTPDAQDADDDGDGTPDASDTDDSNPDGGGGDEEPGDDGEGGGAV